MKGMAFTTAYHKGINIPLRLEINNIILYHQNAHSIQLDGEFLMGTTD